MKTPKRVERCVTHHICDCLQWRMENMESALKVIHTWAAVNGGIALDPRHVVKLCEEALKKVS